MRPDGADSLDDIVLIIRLATIETVVLGQILDAETGELIDDEVRLTFDGPSGDAVIDLFSDPVSHQIVQGGLVSFGIRNSLEPTTEQPVVFQVIAEAEGYQPTGPRLR